MVTGYVNSMMGHFLIDIMAEINLLEIYRWEIKGFDKTPIYGVKLI